MITFYSRLLESFQFFELKPYQSPMGKRSPSPLLWGLSPLEFPQRGGCGRSGVTSLPKRNLHCWLVMRLMTSRREKAPASANVAANSQQQQRSATCL